MAPRCWFRCCSVLLVAVSGVTNQLSPFYAYTLALGLGYLAPDFWLGRRIKQAADKHSTRASGFSRSDGGLYRGRIEPGSGALPDH